MQTRKHQYKLLMFLYIFYLLCENSMFPQKERETSLLNGNNSLKNGKIQLKNQHIIISNLHFYKTKYFFFITCITNTGIT